MRRTVQFCLIGTMALLLSGCGPQLVKGLSPQMIEQQAVVMIANSDMMCGTPNGRVSVSKGTAFSVKVMQGIEYRTPSGAGLAGETANMITGGERFTFQENTLLLKWDDTMDTGTRGGSGFVVYPNGTFVYQDYVVAVFNTFNGDWWMLPGTCSFNADSPFEVKDRR